MTDYAGYSAGLPYTYTSSPLYYAYLQQLMQQQQQMQQYYAKQQQTQQMQQSQQQSNTPAQNTSASQQVRDFYAAQNDPALLAVLQNQQEASGCTDGSDDGSLSAEETLETVAESAVDYFKGMFCDEDGFSLSKTAKTVTVIGLGALATYFTGGAALPYLVAAGVTLGGAEAAGGAYQYATAKTDAQAKQGIRKMTSGTITVASSIAGAKSAVEATGGAVESGMLGSLKATKDCFKIAGSGAWNGGKALLTNPMQSARNVQAYYNNTIKPNAMKAFSWKTAHENYTTAMEESLNNSLKSTNEKLTALQDELLAHPEKAAELNPKIQNLKAEVQNLEGQIVSNEFAQKYAAEKDLWTQLENDPSLTDADRLFIEALKKQGNSASKILLNNETKNRLAMIENLKSQIKTATGDTKLALEQQLKLMEAQHKALTAQTKIEIAQYNVENANSNIAKLQADLKQTGLTEAEKTAINSRISKIEKAVAGDKQILRNKNIMIAAKQTLPKTALPTTALYLGSESSSQHSKNDFTLALLQEQNAALAQQQAAWEAQQAAQRTAAQTTNTQTTTQTGTSQMTNPNGMMSQTMPMSMYQGAGLDFNSLYVSPYPDIV